MFTAPCCRPKFTPRSHLHFRGAEDPQIFGYFRVCARFRLQKIKKSKEGEEWSSPSNTARLATPIARRPTVRERCAGLFSPTITHAYALLHSPPLLMNRLPESNLLICFHRAQARHRPLQGVPRRLRRGYRHLHQVPLRVNLALGQATRWCAARLPPSRSDAAHCTYKFHTQKTLGLRWSRGSVVQSHKTF